MARTRALIFAGVAAIAAVLVLFLALAPSAEAAPGRPDMAAPKPAQRWADLQPAGPVAGVLGDFYGKQNWLASDAVASAAALTCTLITTVTSDVTGNYTFTTAVDLVNLYTNLSLAPGTPGQVVTVSTQYFRIGSAVPGLHYIVEAIPNGVGNYNLGIIVYDRNLNFVMSDLNALDNTSARIDLTAVDTGPYYFAVVSLSPVCPSGTYRLTAVGPVSSTPTPTGSPTVTPSSTPIVSPIPGADRFEPNYNFDIATTIALDELYTNLNFAPWAGSSPTAPDNDYYRVWVKPGLLITCETSDLGPGADTNLILYDNNGNGIGGNDDINRAAGNFASRVSYYTTYEGWLYALVGNVSPVDPPSLGATYTYSFDCYLGSGPTATPTVTRPPVTPVPTIPPTPTPIPTLPPTPTPTPPFIRVDVLPTSTPVGQSRVVIPINLTVYYDANNNNRPDPGEGVVGISARVIDVATGQELVHTFTDEFGFASLTTSATGVVRLIVPYLGYTVPIQPTGSSIVLRIAPVPLPDVIP